MDAQYPESTDSRRAPRCTAGCEHCGRLRTGLLAALADRDAVALSEEAVAAAAGLSPAAFAEHYGTLDACLLAAHDELAEELYLSAAAALDGEGDWHGRLARGIDSGLERLAAVPGAWRLWFVESARIGDIRMQERRTAARDRFVHLVAERHPSGREPESPELHFEFLIGALFRAAQEEVAAGGDARRVRGRVRELLALLEPVPA